MTEVTVSKEGLDPEWDDFLETRPDGCYQQSSLWAKLKSLGSWKHLRLVVREQGEIVGGAQMLLRPLRPFGAVGYISKGPVIAPDDPTVQEYILDQLDRVARIEHILFLKMQPPYGAEAIARRLLERGALPSAAFLVSQATARVDIRPEPEDILAGMKRTRRQPVQRAEREGVVVRQGTEADMPLFNALVKDHSKRKEYDAHSERYYDHVWSIFSSRNRASLFVAEYKDDVLAAMLAIFFGDVAYPLFIGDSGRHSKLSAQSLLVWKSMLWGRERGCAWYDFGGISLSIARAILDNEPIPDTRAGGLTHFKMSFGSQVLLRPAAHDISYVWPRWLTCRMVPTLAKMKPLVRSLLGGSLWGDFRGALEQQTD